MRERCFNYDLAFDHILPTGCQYHCFQTLREECSCAVARMAAATVTIVIFVTFAPHRLWKIAAWLMRTFSWKSRAYANRMPYVVFSKSSRFGEDKIHLADVFHSATHQETFNDLLVHQHGNGFFTTSRCTSSIPDMQWKSFPLPLPTVSLTRVYPPTLTIPYYFFWGEGLGTSHQLHSILQVGATKQIPHTKKQQTRVIYVYILFFLSGLDFVGCFFSSILSPLAQKEDHHSRQTRLQTRCPPWEASTSGRRRPQGWDWGGFFQPERCCNWKKEVGNGEFKNTRAYYVYMYIFMRYHYIIITIFMIKSLSFELRFFSSSLS